jgi:anaphase-promoting complex subunit 1
MALALMYLRTNNEHVAAHLNAPETSALLECVQPELLKLRTIAHNLILFDAMRPTRDWLMSQIPAFIHQAVDFLRQLKTGKQTIISVNLDYAQAEMCRQAYFYLVAGALFALSLKFAGSADREAYDLVMDNLALFQKEFTSPGMDIL